MHISREEHDSLHQRSLVVDVTDNAVMIGGPDTRVVHVNPGFTRLLGYTLDDMRGKRPIEVLAGPHTDVHSLEQARGDLPGLGGSYRAESLIYTKAGQPLWVAAVVNPVRGADGRLHSVVGVLSDITLTKMHEVLQHQVLHAMVRELPVADLMAMVCVQVERIAPELRCTVLEVDTLGMLHPLAGPGLPTALGEALDGRPARVPAVELSDVASDDWWQPHRPLLLPLGLARCWSVPIQASDGAVLGSFGLYLGAAQAPSTFHRRLLGICVQLCALALERERVKARMERLASVDALTGLSNRMTVCTRAERMLEELRPVGAPLAVLSINLDRFKRVNDNRGHGVGDAMLREVAGRIERGVRSIDLTGRLSGDEFVVILPSCSVDRAALAAERLLAAVAEPMTLDGLVQTESASIGVAMFPDDGGDIDALLLRADLAMAQAKRDKHGSTRFFNEEMQQRTRERVALEAALREQLRGGGLRMQYQPQVYSANPQQLYGVEALARWSHPLHGEIAPTRFIPLAEEAGLIDDLGRWALAEACQQMARWRREGVPVPRVAVNLSSRNFQNRDLPAVLAALLLEHGLASEDLTLEMTESVMLGNGSAEQTTMAALRTMGVRLALDDFGTGYSSLSYLHRLRIHELKLDQSFVRDLSTSTTAQALTNTIVRIGESLDLTVVAEGVETQAQSDFLTGRGCGVLQGYLFGRPMPGAALGDWLAERQR